MIRTKRSTWAGFFAALALIAAVRAAGAQTEQYQAPGDHLNRPQVRREALEEATQEARWTLGRLRLDPWIGIRDASWINNVFSEGAAEVDDFTITLGAGLRGYLSAGRYTTLSFWALPEYVWWADLRARRRLNGRYGGGVFAYFNRLTVEAEAQSAVEQRILSPEIEQLVHQRRSSAEFNLGLRIYRSIEAFAEVVDLDFTHLVDEVTDVRVPDYAQLDREERIFRAGLRLDLGRRLTVGGGLEDAESVFVSRLPVDRSNEGTAPFVQLEWSGARTLGSARLTRRDLRPIANSDFPRFDEVTGSILLQFQTSNARRRASVFIRRDLIYGLGSSLTASFVAFTDQTFGAGYLWRIGSAWSYRVFAETGKFDYLPSSASVERVDDFDSVGTSVAYDLWGAASIGIQAVVRELDSNVSGLDRTITQVGLTFSLGTVSWP